MEETYQNLGPEISWTFGAAIALAAIIGVIWRSFRAKKLTIEPFQIGALVFGLVIALWPTPIPMVVAYPAPILFIGIAAFFAKPKDEKVTKRRRMVVGIGATVMSVVTFFLYLNLVTGSLVLDKNNVTWESSYRNGQVSREGLKVHATGGRNAWHNNHQWWSWTSFSDKKTDNPIDHLGPSLIGFELYWGPDGMVTGDELGVRLAEWAGTEPKYRTSAELDAEIEAAESRS